MANHYVAINRGVSGGKISDFVFGASSSASADFELRIGNVDAQGNTPTDKDVVLALEAFKRAILSGAIYTNFPPL
jgi:hypothetical protein